MKIETSTDLLERLRAKHGASWYGLAKLLRAHENTVYSWKGGHTVVDRKFAPRLAELLEESPEYVLACLEAEREQHAEVLKVWQRIAAKFRGRVASVLFAAAIASGSGALPGQQVGTATPDGGALLYILWQIGRRLSRLFRGLKPRAATPLHLTAWIRARNRSTGFRPSIWLPTPVST